MFLNSLAISWHLLGDYGYYLVFLKLKESIDMYVEHYLADMRNQIIAVYENWWDKYRMRAREIEGEMQYNQYIIGFYKNKRISESNMSLYLEI